MNGDYSGAPLSQLEADMSETDTKTCDKCHGTGRLVDEPVSVITVRGPKTLHDHLNARARDEKTSLNKLCVKALLEYVAKPLAILLSLCAVGAAQIDLPGEVSPFEPIVARCNCVTPNPNNENEQIEVRLRWALTSEDPDRPAFLLPVAEGDKDNAHIWGSPGKHNLVATSVWMHYEIITITDINGNERQIRNLLNWNTETYQHRFEIQGRPPNPDNQPPVADAGDDQQAKPAAKVQLDGSSSSDPDGDEMSFLWVLIPPAGSRAKLSQADIVKPTFVADVEGEYTARLTVDDGEYSAYSSTTVTVSDVPEGPRWVVWMEESSDRTPAQAALQVAIRRNRTTTNSSFWVSDKDRDATWAPSYNRYREQAGQKLPCLFVVDVGTKEVLYLGDVPKTVAEYDRIVKEHGG